MASSVFLRSGARTRTRFRVLAVVGVVAVLLLCFLPTEMKLALHTRGRLHSVGHFVVFFGVAYVLNRTSRSPLVRAVLFGLTLVLAVGTEFGEHMMFGTEVEWLDIAVDGLGTMVGVLLSRYSSRRAVSAGAMG